MFQHGYNLHNIYLHNNCITELTLPNDYELITVFNNPQIKIHYWYHNESSSDNKKIIASKDVRFIRCIEPNTKLYQRPAKINKDLQFTDINKPEPHIVLV